MDIKFIFAESEEHILIIKKLFNEYASGLDFDLDFQDFDKELAELPGEYAPPEGRLLLALSEKEAVGCVALRKFAPCICEMKRLYIRPHFRGKGIGRELVKIIILEGKKIGYKKMLLDTVPSMKEAIALYRSIGFHEIPPYRNNPVEGAVFMELNLDNIF